MKPWKVAKAWEMVARAAAVVEVRMTAVDVVRTKMRDQKAKVRQRVVARIVLGNGAVPRTSKAQGARLAKVEQNSRSSRGVIRIYSPAGSWEVPKL